jgi:group I intron endonuclease
LKKFYLYKITNTINDKVYIGMTYDPDARFKQHMRKDSTCTKLKHAIQCHGKENFRMEILCIGQEDYIIDLEYKAILSYDSIENGYNLVLGNPRTGGTLLSQEVKDKISSGLNKFHSENEAWNKGIVIGRRKEYDPHYVCGFWFPHLDVANEVLGIKFTTLYKWRKEGILGETKRLREDSNQVPLYVAGFWFDTLTRASHCLNQKSQTLLKRLRDGNIEEKSQKTYKTGQDNHMTGRVGFAHHRSKAVEVDGIVYGSISQAAKETGFTKKMIYTRLKNNTPGFAWVKQGNK